MSEIIRHKIIDQTRYTVNKQGDFINNKEVKAQAMTFTKLNCLDVTIWDGNKTYMISVNLDEDK